MEIKKLNKKRKRIIFIISVVFSLFLLLFGGGTLLLYLLILCTGLFFGYHIKSIVTVIQDYRLSLKINTVLFNSKESEKMKETIKQLQHELQTAETRLNLKEVKE